MFACILCLSGKATDCIDIYSAEGQLLDIELIIKKHFWLQPSDIFTDQSICNECWQTLHTFHKFYLRVQHAHKHLEAVTSLKQCVVADADPDFTETDPNFKIETLNIKLELDTTVETNPKIKRKRGRPRGRKCTKAENLSSKTSAEPTTTKTIPLLPECPIDQADIEQLYDTTDVKDETLQTDYLGTDNDLASEVELTNEPPFENQLDDYDYETELRSSLAPGRKQSEKTLVSRQYDDFIAVHFKLNCCLCQESLDNFAELKTHFRVQHKMRGYVLCCGKKLLKRGVLVDHIHVHKDPKYFKCPRCEKVMADRRCLDMHVKGHEEKRERTHRCEVCSKSFFRQSVYMRHVMLHVPEEEKKIGCPECDKTFATKYIMNQHLRLVHLNVYSKICDICGKSIRGREALRRHQEEHAGVRASIQCELCGIKLTSKYGLTRHMKVRHTEENLQPQVCGICSKVSPNLSAHQRHVKYMHTMQRKHACPMCDKAFKRANDLKEHMTTHTGEVLYTCPHCPKTFNSNANMHSHRKKMHRKEWEERRLQKYLMDHTPETESEQNNLSVADQANVSTSSVAMNIN